MLRYINHADSISYPKTEPKIGTFMLLISVHFSVPAIYKPYIFSIESWHSENFKKTMALWNYYYSYGHGS